MPKTDLEVECEFDADGKCDMVIRLKLGKPHEAMSILADYPPEILAEYERCSDIAIAGLARECEEYEAYRDEVMAGYDAERFI